MYLYIIYIFMPIDIPLDRAIPTEIYIPIAIDRLHE
jgi:hypothetical protein